MAKKNTEEPLDIDLDSGFDSEDSQTQAVHATPAATALPDAGNLNQVREILLGPVTQGLEQRLSRLEQQVQESLGKLTEQTSSRLDEIQQRTDEQLSKLSAEIVQDREQHAQKVEQEIKGVVDELETKVARLFDLSEGVRAEIAGELKTIATEVEQLSTTVTSQMESETQRLRDELVDRNSLAAALSEVALRLSGSGGNVDIDPSQPDAELDALLGNISENRPQD